MSVIVDIPRLERIGILDGMGSPQASFVLNPKPKINGLCYELLG